MRPKLRTIFLLLVCCSSFLYSQNSKAPEKKILILSSHGGGGHAAASATIQKILEGQYSFTVVHPIDEVKFWGIVPSGESLYNKIMGLGWIRTVNFCTKHVAPAILREHHPKIQKMVEDYIESANPDLIISLIPFINLPASEAARKNDIPYLLITTDNDLKNWVHGLDKITHPNFQITIGTELPSTKGILIQNNISASQIKTIGLPLRPSFLEKKDKAALREKYQNKDKPTVLIMMGGAGNFKAYEYAEALCKSDLGIHVIVITGKNTDLLKQLQTLTPAENNSLQLIGFTDNVADYMAISDLLITKPGPGTINEAIQMKLPILIDRSSQELYWEKANRKLVHFYGIGEDIKKTAELPGALRKYLLQPEFREKVLRAFDRIPQNSFKEEIKMIIAQLCNSHTSSEEDSHALFALTLDEPSGR